MEADLNKAIWKLNASMTLCDKCERHIDCYKNGILMVFYVLDDIATVPDYDYKGAHGMLKGGKVCPKVREKYGN